MTSLFTGAGGMVPAKLVHIGRSDGCMWTTQQITAKKGAKHVGEPLSEDLNHIADDESRKKLAEWKVVVGSGLSEEMGWPKGRLDRVSYA